MGHACMQDDKTGEVNLDKMGLEWNRKANKASIEYLLKEIRNQLGHQKFRNLKQPSEDATFP